MTVVALLGKHCESIRSADSDVSWAIVDSGRVILGENLKKSLDPERFVELMLTHDSRVRGFVRSLMLPASEVDDVFQNACLAAFRKLDTFSFEGETPDQEFVRWVCTIARYEVLQVYRKKRNAKVVFSSDLIKELADMQLQETEQLLDRAEALVDCINSLSDKERSLITMRYREDTPVADIATFLGRSANGVYKALERVRARLMECVRRKLSTASVPSE